MGADLRVALKTSCPGMSREETKSGQPNFGFVNIWSFSLNSGNNWSFQRKKSFGPAVVGPMCVALLTCYASNLSWRPLGRGCPGRGGGQACMEKEGGGGQAYF